MADDNIQNIVGMANNGKTYEQIAEELGYSSKTVISTKLRGKGYTRNNKFTKANNGRQRIASISREELKQAGGDVEGEQHYKKQVEDGKIVLKLTGKKIDQE